ncbi:MAG: hypothetical protein IJ168_03100 [Eubacterium sp.]|nr:hypothetical protein [Eubacterium sp.]
MKKILSVVLSLVMLIAVGAIAMTAFGETVVSPTTKEPNVITEVNGKPSKAVTYTKDSDSPRVYTFTYTGTGKLIGWEFPGMVEGKDYKITSQKGNSITIEVSDDYEGDIIANAIVEEAVEPSPSPVSPKTGASLAGVAAMGAGAAILAISKKRKND